MQSHALALAEQAKTWKFLELWVDPFIFPPKILTLVGNQEGTCHIFNPALNYKLVVTHFNYAAAQDWLLEDEYERVKGKILAEERRFKSEVQHSVSEPSAVVKLHR